MPGSVYGASQLADHAIELCETGRIEERLPQPIQVKRISYGFSLSGHFGPGLLFPGTGGLVTRAPECLPPNFLSIAPIIRDRIDFFSLVATCRRFLYSWSGMSIVVRTPISQVWMVMESTWYNAQIEQNPCERAWFAKPRNIVGSAPDGRLGGSGGVTGIAPRHPPTPPDVRFSASGG